MDKFHHPELRPDTAAASYGARRLLTGRGGLRPGVAVCRRVCLQAQLVVLNSTASKD